MVIKPAFIQPLPSFSQKFPEKCILCYVKRLGISRGSYFWSRLHHQGICRWSSFNAWSWCENNVWWLVTLTGAGCFTRDIMKKAVVAWDIIDREDSNTCDKVRALSNIVKWNVWSIITKHTFWSSELMYIYSIRNFLCNLYP